MRACLEFFFSPPPPTPPMESHLQWRRTVLVFFFFLNFPPFPKYTTTCILFRFPPPIISDFPPMDGLGYHLPLSGPPDKFPMLQSITRLRGQEMIPGNPPSYNQFYPCAPLFFHVKLSCPPFLKEKSRVLSVLSVGLWWVFDCGICGIILFRGMLSVFQIVGSFPDTPVNSPPPPPERGSRSRPFLRFSNFPLCHLLPSHDCIRLPSFFFSPTTFFGQDYILRKPGEFSPFLCLSPCSLSFFWVIPK